MKKTFFLSFLFQLVAVFGFAQEQKTEQLDDPRIKRCGTTEFMEQLMQRDISVRLEQEKAKAKREKLGSQLHKQLPCATVYEIPVAIHFAAGIGTTAAERECLRYLVSSQIEVLNNSFAGEELSAGSDACIRFVLGNSNHPAGALMYPSGPALVNGDPAITYNGAYTCPLESPCTISTWSGYMNIAVQPNTSLLGISFVGGALSSFNTLVIDACAFGTYSGCTEAGPSLCGSTWRYDGGITAVHEIGHFLDLPHVFCNDTNSGTSSCGGGGGCDGSDDCDGITDTPAQCESVYFCGSTADNPCTAASGDPIIFPNFMDYGDDACLNLFTDGQIAVMNAHIATIIGNARPNINNAPCPNIWNGTLTKTGNSTVCSGTTVSTCVEVDLINDADATVEFSDNAGSTFSAGTLSPRPDITVHTITLNPFANYGMPAGPIYEGDVVMMPATTSHPIRTDVTAGGFPTGAIRFGHNATSVPIKTTFPYVVLVPGNYFIECANHPGTMNGSFTVIARPKATYCKDFVESNTTCNSQLKTFHARWNAASQDSDCGGDLQTTNGAGATLTTTVYPLPQIPSNIVTNVCTVTVTPACAGSLGAASSPSGSGVEIADWDAATGTYTADEGDAAGTITITVNGVSGAPAGCTSTTFDLTTPIGNCIVLTPDFSVAVSDPCQCANDATALTVAADGSVNDLNATGTGNSDGHFDETITATYDADNATPGIQVDANVGYHITAIGPNVAGGTAPTGIAVGDQLAAQGDGTYTISFQHTSGVGYTLTLEAVYVQDPDGAGPIAVGDVIAGSTLPLNPTPCQYPEIVFSALPTNLTACAGSTFDLSTLTTPTTDITFSGANVSGTTFDVAAAGNGTHSISVNINPADATPPASQDGDCLQPYNFSLNVAICPPACQASGSMNWGD
ncbi:MAG: hypothetical protein JNM36_10240 [Chitinophagales bacterium]|nr:hypothetical protein [Chitinophagales bacterium]